MQPKQKENHQCRTCVKRYIYLNLAEAMFSQRTCLFTCYLIYWTYYWITIPLVKIQKYLLHNYMKNEISFYL
jgi:hypothetical protein